ncbi:MAG: lipopolysaccharide biosynthesis protein [Mesorhizobium sp.]|uniref:lipopolysaccharide biosynthesis protein n=1 Tax=Mesorhizobium sp. TaxID=1871066 RepID=UPI0011F8E2F7|nr:lipopolysaccharide biosynthesis protein [Mesorhizobium sp.]TIL62421.1 MAG: lipopolysaccharide biosynthesis protein [Mesorhizobium sp.]TIL94352.1 MAG: lipopolysaccharide biosynthesis protein [Mesorhizobium sp.]
MTSIGAKIVTGAAWTAVETWGRQAAMFAVFVVLARHLGPEAFGLAALSMVVPVILAVPVTTGIPEALIQHPKIESLHFDSAFWLLAASGAVISGLIWMSAGLIAAAFGQPILEDLIRWSSVVVVIQALSSVPAAVLKRQLEFRLFALRTLAGTVVGGILGIVLAIGGFGVWSMIWMHLAKAAVETAVLLVGSSWRPRLTFSYAKVRDLLGFGGPLIVQTFWSFLNEEIPKVLLGTFLGPHAVGVYALARRPLDLLVQVFLSPLMAVTMPTVARIQDQPEKIDRFFNTTVRIAGIAGFPAFIGFAAIAPIAVPFIFGPQWASGVVAVQILMLLGLQRTIDSLCAFTILAMGHSRLILKLNIAYSVVATMLLSVTAQISLEMTMVALVACGLVLLPIFLFYAQRIARIDVLRPLEIFPRLALAALLMFGAVSAWLSSAPEHASQETLLISAIVLGAAVYCTALFVLVRSDLFNARDLFLRLRG